MIRTPAGLGALLFAAPLAAAVSAHGAADSSLLSWIDAFGAGASARLDDAGPGSVHLLLIAGRGVDDRKARQVVGPHILARLQAGGRTVSRDRGAITLTITLSIEGDSAWAVGLLEGGSLPAPVAIAQAWPVDRELDVVLGAAGVRAGQGRWAMDRLGTLPPGILDLTLLDLDDDGGDDLVVLSVDGVRTLAWSELEGRPVPLGGPYALGGDDAARWPRVAAGWLAVQGESVAVATTSGLRVRLDPVSGAIGPSADDVLLAQPSDPSREPFAASRWSGPSADLILVEPAPGLPDSVRDLARWPGRDDTWLWVDSSGLLGGLGADGPARFERSLVGDRILLDDLDGDGRQELVVSAASAPGTPDRIRILGVDPGLTALPVIFDGALFGSVAAIASGDLDFDGRRELLVVEQTDSDAVLWLIARRR